MFAITHIYCNIYSTTPFSVICVLLSFSTQPVNILLYNVNSEIISVFLSLRKKSDWCQFTIKKIYFEFSALLILDIYFKYISDTPFRHHLVYRVLTFLMNSCIVAVYPSTPSKLICSTCYSFPFLLRPLWTCLFMSNSAGFLEKQMILALPVHLLPPF